MRWVRAAELSCDRAALLVVGDPRVVVSVLMKLSGGCPKLAGAATPERVPTIVPRTLPFLFLSPRHSILSEEHAAHVSSEEAWTIAGPYPPASSTWTRSWTRRAGTTRRATARWVGTCATHRRDSSRTRCRWRGRGKLMTGLEARSTARWVWRPLPNLRERRTGVSSVARWGARVMRRARNCPSEVHLYEYRKMCVFSPTLSLFSSCFKRRSRVALSTAFTACILL